MRKELLSIFLVLGGFVSWASGQSVTIHMDSIRQNIRGFGGIHINSWQGTELNEDLREKAFGNEPGEMGLSILRLRIEPDSNRFNSELDIALHAVSKGAIVFASPWNPPASLLDPESSINRVPYELYGEYAAHLNRFTRYMNDNGVPLYAVSVQNEPDWGEWTRWTAQEIATFLSENGDAIDTRIIAPESFQFRHDYTDVILNDAEAVANLDIVGGHIYGGGLEDYPLARQLGKEVWMTEHLTGSGSPEQNTWGLALALGTEINDCMEANFNAYVWWYIRRFYGLITDDGNISKKGYVMSQFSKFIRPGALRVDAIRESVTGIETSAFKTDTSLVIVVVNNNATETGLEFILEDNAGIDSLTKFTTSEFKNMVNDGGVSVSANSFTTVVDARSVTTFTSWTGAGGKFGNIPPIADAGPDTVIVDSTGIGMFDVLLDASASTDPDGEIVNISWSVDERQVSWDTTHVASFGVGEHLAVLTVTDEDGARDIDTLIIRVDSPFNTEIWMEAECGIVGSTWEINMDIHASQWYYVNTPAGTQSLDAASADTADHIILNFHIDEAGPYKVWGRVIAPSPDDDSFWIRMDDDAEWAGWNNIVGGGDWHWDDVHNWSNENPVTYQLDTGYHTLSICFREDGTLLDKVLITNTGMVPEGPGGADTTCDYTDISDPQITASAEVIIYPNPARDIVHIRWDEGFCSLMLIGLDGRAILREDYPGSVQSTALELNLEPGIYFLRVQNGGSFGLRTLVVR